jgi:hypothetical protein
VRLDPVRRGAVFTPGVSLAADTTRAAACNVYLRTKATTSASAQVLIKTDARVTVTRAVAGTAYKTTCSGRSVSGSTWFLISAINGKTVKSLYGISYVYGRPGCSRPSRVPGLQGVPANAAVLGRAEEGPAQPEHARDRRSERPRRGVPHALQRCLVSGVTWLRIDAIKGRSIRSLYGIDSIYAPLAIFKPSPVSTVAPAPSPTPSPGSTPAPTPTATPKHPRPRRRDAVQAAAEHARGHRHQPLAGHDQLAAVARAGKKFAFMKASEDTWYVDPTYPTNKAQAKANGIAVGAYHFAQPSTAAGNATAQADHFIDTANPSTASCCPSSTSNARVG